jgi:hypothetical protein
MGQLQQIIDKLTSCKAPGPDEIANLAIKNAFPIAKLHLLVMIQASIDIGHSLKHLKGLQLLSYENQQNQITQKLTHTARLP